jgi:glycosyltransferase involved in cell wall biosynthesis
MRVLYVMHTAAPDGSSASLLHLIAHLPRDASGLIVPPRDPAALAGAIVRLADDPALRSRLGAAARAGAARRSDPTVVADRVVEIYREVMVSRGTGSGRRPRRSSGSRSRP